MMGQPDAAALEAAAALLEASQDYRVLRRLQPRAPVTAIPEQDTRLGLFVDVETTGLDPSKDEIIELAMVPFRYSLDGIIVDVGEPFDRLREPVAPICHEDQGRNAPSVRRPEFAWRRGCTFDELWSIPTVQLSSMRAMRSVSGPTGGVPRVGRQPRYDRLRLRTDRKG